MEVESATQDKEMSSSSTNVSKYTFLVEWYDPVAQIIKKFCMTFHVNDQTVELYDMKNHRPFLRRCKQDGIHLDNLHKNAIVTVMSRQLKIVDYADKVTRNKFEVELTQTFCMIKPDVTHKVGEILTFMYKKGFKIIGMKMGQMTLSCAEKFYKEHEGNSYYASLVAFMSSGASIAMSIIGVDAVKRFKEFLGPMNAEEAKITAPNTLRAIYGTDITKNGVHGSENEEYVAKESEVWFSKPKGSEESIKPSCIGKNTTCCIIKPHAIVDGQLGYILNYILDNGFKITALEMFTLDVSTAEEFLEVYKGVVPEYPAMVLQLTSGPSVALEIQDLKNPECSQATFRKLAGPSDPDIAKKLRPDTIRAKFGKTKVLNAVHCTDLPDDAILEVEYFFKVLQL